MTAPQILARSKIDREAAYCEAALCLNNRGNAAGIKFGAKIHRILGEEKTDSSSCFSIIPISRKIMRYIILIPNYTGSCVQDEFGGEIELENLHLPTHVFKKIIAWHNAYKKIIPLSLEERERKKEEIEELDVQGIELAKSLKNLIRGGAKVKYFSEGKLRYLYVV